MADMSHHQATTPVQRNHEEFECSFLPGWRSHQTSASKHLMKVAAALLAATCITSGIVHLVTSLEKTHPSDANKGTQVPLSQKVR